MEADVPYNQQKVHQKKYFAITLSGSQHTQRPLQRFDESSYFCFAHWRRKAAEDTFAKSTSAAMMPQIEEYSNSPVSGSLTVLLDTPVPLLVMLITAFGTTAPDASRISPETLAF